MGNTAEKKSGVDPKYTVPQGVYPRAAWDPKVLRKLVQERRIAPFFPGSEEKTTEEMEECPICFLYFPSGLNRARCCKKGVCSECFIQIKKGLNTTASCPFCNNRQYAVAYVGVLSKEERDAEEREEKKVLDLRMKMMLEEEVSRKDKKDSSPIPSPAQLSSPGSSFSSSPATPLSTSSPYTSERKDSSASASASSASGDPAYKAAVAFASAAAARAPPRSPSPFVAPPYGDIEEAMLAEAIRRSLLEQPAAAAAPAPAAPAAAAVVPASPLAASDFSQQSVPPNSGGSEPESASPAADPASPLQVLRAPEPRVARRIPLEDSSSSSSSASSSPAPSPRLSRHAAPPRSREEEEAALKEAIRLSLIDDKARQAPPVHSNVQAT